MKPTKEKRVEFTETNRGWLRWLATDAWEMVRRAQSERENLRAIFLDQLRSMECAMNSAEAMVAFNTRPATAIGLFFNQICRNCHVHNPDSPSKMSPMIQAKNAALHLRRAGNCKFILLVCGSAHVLAWTTFSLCGPQINPVKIQESKA